MPLEDGEWIEDEEGTPSDSVNVGAHVNGPPVEALPNGQPPGDTEPQRATAEAPPQEVANESQALPEFDPRARDDFEGLLYLGALTNDFPWMGHIFVIKTLSVDELLEVALLVKEWQGSMGEMKAYATLMVAACTVSVDGRPLPQPISSQPGDTVVRNRFEVVRRWYPTTVDVIYEQYLLLEARVMEVLEAMGKVNGSSRMASTPG